MSYTRNNKAVKGLLGLGSMALMMSGVATAGTITGSAHDMSGQSFTGGQICVTCHVPHNGAEAGSGPLWNHALQPVGTTYTVYTDAGGGSLDATIGTPGGASKLCLSCHDGTVAVDSFGGNTGTINISAGGSLGADGVANGASRDLGTDLSNDHPFSFDYLAVAQADGGPDAGIKGSGTTITIGSGTKTKTDTIANLMLDGSGNMQCTSCHDVHNEYTQTSNTVDGYRLLKISIDGSAICLTCHDK